MDLSDTSNELSCAVFMVDRLRNGILDLVIGEIPSNEELEFGFIENDGELTTNSSEIFVTVEDVDMLGLSKC